MRLHFWSFCLQWSRVGSNVLLFLVATQFLSLSEIGLFATAFAPIRLTQSLHRVGIVETVVILGRDETRYDALFALSVGFGIALSLLFAMVAGLTNTTALFLLSLVPIANGFSAVSEGILRKKLKVQTLAIRTAIAQMLAMAVALALLLTGAGIWALVLFAVLNACITAVLSFYLANWRPKQSNTSQQMSVLLPTVMKISMKDLLGSAVLPMAQLMIGLFLGLSVAGAFQIATRIYNLIDALTLSPLRFVALPDLARRNRPLRVKIKRQLSFSAWLAVWVWVVTLIFANDLLALVLRSDHAIAAAPILKALAGFGLCSAFMMPINQALTARNQTLLVLKRAVVMLITSLLLLAPSLSISVTACALALSSGAVLTSVWYIRVSLPILRLSYSDLFVAVLPVAAASLVALCTLFAPTWNVVLQICLGTLLYGFAFVCLRDPRRLAT